MEREVGGGIGMGNTCKPMAVSFQCMTKSTTNKKTIIIIIKKTHGKERKGIPRRPSGKESTAMQETRVQSLGQEVPLREKWQPTSVFLPGKFH